MKRIWRGLEFLAWAAFFAFAALVLALRFWILPNIEEYRDDIVAQASRAIGQPVKVGRIEAGWLGLHPRITLQDVRILDGQGREALVLPAIENVVAWRSFLARELRLHSLVIEAPRLAVRRDAAGAIYVAGMKLGERGGRAGLSDWVLAQDVIEVRNAEIEWRDDKRAAPPLALSGLSIRLQNEGGRHSVGLNARPPAELGSTLELRALLDGDTLADPDAWSGRAYLELGATDLAGWRAWIDYPWDISRGRGALRLWLTLEKGVLARATADVALAAVAARLGKDLPPVELASVSGRMEATLRDGGYELSAKKLALASASGAAIAPTDLQVSWRPQGKEPEKGLLAAKELELAPLAQLAETLPFPAGARKLLHELEPRGRLSDARVEWTGSLAAPQKLAARARFVDLAARPSGTLPGFTGLTGSLEATESKGSVQLAARKAELDLPRVLEAPVPLDALDGAIEWESGGAGALTVKMSSLAFANEDIEGKVSGSYARGADGKRAVDLEGSLKRGDGSKLPRYLPRAEVMGQGLHDYLARAVVAGRASDVQFRMKGDPADFPFTDPAKGAFRVALRAEKAVLDYVEGWPRIQDIDAELVFERDRMEILGRSATVLGARLSNVRVSIPAMKAPRVVLQVSGQAEGPLSEFLKYIESSPVQRMVGGFTDAILADGRGRLRLKLDLPLQELAATKVAGEADLTANSITVHPSLPPVERVAGRLTFSETGLAFHDVKGRFIGGPVTVSGGSKAGSGVEVVARGDATVAATQPIFDHPWRRYLSGAAPYTATVTSKDGRTRVSFESSLRGVTSTLPPPFSKSAAEALPLRVDMVPGDSGGRDRISIAVARLAAAELLRRRQGEAMTVQRAALWLTPAADQAVRVPERPGVLIYGSLPELDLDRWLALSAADPQAAAGATPGEAAATTTFELKAGILDVIGKRLHDAEVRGGADANGWSANVKAAELSGDLTYRGEKGGQLLARLAHFRIPEDYPGAKASDSGRTRELPSVDLVAERFTFRDKELGRIEVVAGRAPEGWRIDRLALVNTEASVNGKGLWRTSTGAGAASSTSVSFDLESSDSGRFLERLGYPGLVRGARAKMQGSVMWLGDPTAIDYASLSGAVQLQAEEGQFLEIEPGIGKLVSLMSLQMLPKRLTLDFRDVFSKGFQFDRIAAAADIDKGTMRIRDFNMRGSAADVEMKGEVNLAKEEQNLQVRVLPQLGDTASTVIGLINPLLIFPAAIAQRILKDPLSHIFAFNYVITGNWSDPKVAKRGVEAKEAPQKAE